MTTAWTEGNKNHPTPAELNRRLAWACAERLRVRQERHARRRRLLAYSLAVLIACEFLWLFPSYTLAGICLGLPSAWLLLWVRK